MKNETLETYEEYTSMVEAANDYVEHFDILETITNVGNDEVFTPGKVCGEMLDSLPDEVWHDKEYRWLIPCTKNGIFEREIAIRLNEGLKESIPNEEERKKHILQKMLHSIGLTRFTSLVARRTLYYCSYANRSDDGEAAPDGHSVNGYAIGNGTWFNDEEGNIKTPTAVHTFGKDGKCIYCGVKKGGKYDSDDQTEHYAYEFIHHFQDYKHNDLSEYLCQKFFGGNKDMKFDIIIGNPPYHMNDGGAKASATPIYHLFVERAIELNPKYICMIIPSRWMQGGKGLTEFRQKMLGSEKIRTLHDFADSKMVFPASFSIEGGICYFVWDRDYHGKCHFVSHDVDDTVNEDERYINQGDTDVVLRDRLGISIIEKVKSRLPDLKSQGIIKNDSFSKIVSVQKPYGFRTDFLRNPDKYGLPNVEDVPQEGGYRILGRINSQVVKYLPNNYPLPINKPLEDTGINKFKIFLGRANGRIGFKQIIPSKIIAEPTLGFPGDCCTETYLQIGPFDIQEEQQKCFEYMKTKFFRILLGIKKIGQDIPRDAFDFIPIPNFSKESSLWQSDEMLFQEFGLSQEEIDYINYYVADVSDWTGKGLLS